MAPTLQPIRSWTERQLAFKKCEAGKTVRLTIGQTASWKAAKHTSLHKHELYWDSGLSGVICDSCEHQTFGTWHCKNEKCDYDICGQCMQEELDKSLLKMLTMKYHHDFRALATRWKEIFSFSKYNQYAFKMSDIAKLMSTPLAQLEEWVESGGQTPKNFDHQKLKKVIDKILKRQKLLYEGREYKLEPPVFDPVFTRPDREGAVEPASPPKPVKEPPPAANKKSKKTKKKANNTASKKRKRKADISRRKKQKTQDVGPKSPAYDIDWKQDPIAVADQLNKAGWKLKITMVGDKKICHFIAPDAKKG